MAANPRDIEEELEDLQVHIPDDMSVFSDRTVPLDAAELARQANDAETQAKIGRLEATIATLPLLIQQIQELQRELKLQAEARAAADRQNEQLRVQLSEQQRTIATLNEQLTQTQTEQQRAREAQAATVAAQKLAIENEAKFAREERARAEATRLAADNAAKEKEKERLADLNKRIGSNGETRLHLAVQANDIQNVATLLGAKADPNIADNNQKMPLFHAFQAHGAGTCFRVLLANGADPNQVAVKYYENWQNGMIYMAMHPPFDPIRHHGTSLSGYASLAQGHRKYGNPHDATLANEIAQHYKPRPNPT